jgi:hypothetical protein
VEDPQQNKERPFAKLTLELVMVGANPVLTLFSVEHTGTLDSAVVRNQLAETPSTGQSNRLGGPV